MRVACFSPRKPSEPYPSTRSLLPESPPRSFPATHPNLCPTVASPSWRRTNQPVAFRVRASLAFCKLSGNSKATASPHPRMRMHAAFEARRTLPHSFDSDGSFVHGLGLLFKSGSLTVGGSFGTCRRRSFRTGAASRQSSIRTLARAPLSGRRQVTSNDEVPGSDGNGCPSGSPFGSAEPERGVSPDSRIRRLRMEPRTCNKGKAAGSSARSPRIQPPRGGKTGEPEFAVSRAPRVKEGWPLRRAETLSLRSSIGRSTPALHLRLPRAKSAENPDRRRTTGPGSSRVSTAYRSMPFLVEIVNGSARYAAFSRRPFVCASRTARRRGSA